jgi:hypothetical protein
MKIQIKNRFDDSIIFEHESENNTIKETLLKAIESGADLSGAKDENGNIIIKYLHIKGSEHMVSWYGNNKIQIGCHTKTIEKWKECYEAVGVSESYEPDQIAEYKTYIIFCEQMQNSLVREETL